MKKIIPAIILCLFLLAGCSDSDSSSSSKISDSSPSQDSSVADSISDNDSSDNTETSLTTTAATTTTTTTEQIHKPKITIDELIELSKKGEELSWADFEQYEGKNTGSGQNVLELEIDGGYTLYVIGVDIPTDICLSNSRGGFIDVLKDDIEAFVESSENGQTTTTPVQTDASDDIESFVTTPVTTTPATTTTPTVTTKTTTTATAIVTEKASGVKYANCVANMRSGNSTDYPVVIQVAKNTKVTITGKCSNGWYAVEVNGKTGYMSSSVLSDAPITTTTTTTTTKKTTTTTTTTKKPTTTTTTTTGSSGGNISLPYDAQTVEFINEVLRLTNEFRAENGVAPLTLDVNLTAVAMVRANELTDTFSHTRPDGSSCFTAFNEGGFVLGTNCSARGENIAAGQATAAAVVEAWKNSTQGHREAMLNAEYTKLGVGYVYVSGDPYKHYWTQNFVG